ncbi:MAG TPA: TerB family tellurite resistance protein [Vicinamibacterales bacterium]|nr:TerB family tellurite resistance protein [Vicinamibacterales bacterium]
MSFLKFLGLQPHETRPGDTDTVRRIVGELEQMDPGRARYLAAFAYVLSRVANADLQISDKETRMMEAIIRDVGQLPEEQAVLVVQIAKTQNRLVGGTEDFLVTREFRQIATPEQCRQLIDCLFAVSAADDSISSAEETQIWQVASELGMAHDEFAALRLRYRDKREVLRTFRDQLK